MAYIHTYTHTIQYSVSLTFLGVVDETGITKLPTKSCKKIFV